MVPWSRQTCLVRAPEGHTPSSALQGPGAPSSAHQGHGHALFTCAPGPDAACATRRWQGIQFLPSHRPSHPHRIPPVHHMRRNSTVLSRCTSCPRRSSDASRSAEFFCTAIKPFARRSHPLPQNHSARRREIERIRRARGSVIL